MLILFWLNSKWRLNFKPTKRCCIFSYIVCDIFLFFSVSVDFYFSFYLFSFFILFCWIARRKTRKKNSNMIRINKKKWTQSFRATKNKSFTQKFGMLISHSSSEIHSPYRMHDSNKEYDSSISTNVSSSTGSHNSGWKG